MSSVFKLGRALPLLAVCTAVVYSSASEAAAAAATTSGGNDDTSGENGQQPPSGGGRRLSESDVARRMSLAHRLLDEDDSDSGGGGSVYDVAIEDFASILDSDVARTFGYVEGDESAVESARRRWADYARFDYANAVAAEERYYEGNDLSLDYSDILYCYVICSKSPDSSARARKNEIFEFVVSNMGDISTEGQDVTLDEFRQDYLNALETVYNGPDKTCAFGRFRASIIGVVAMFEQVSIVPLNTYMKARSGLIEEILAASYPDRPTRGPDGEVIEKDEAKEEGEEAVTYNNTSLEVVLCAGATQNDLERLGDKVVDFMLRRSADGEGSYVASQTPWANLTTEELAALSDRALFWREVFDLGIDSDVGCRSFLERLRTEVTLDLDPSTNRTGAGMRISIDELDQDNFDVDVACGLGLIFAVGLLPQVCSVELTKIVTTDSNAESQWITQGGSNPSGRPGGASRPFWDAGIQGEGQVVAVSDSGIDVNHCYFLDEQNDVAMDGSTNTASRKIVQYDPFVDGEDEPAGHGTHVAGTVAGHKSLGGREVDGLEDGVARNAKIAFIDCGRYCGPGCGTLSIPPTDRLMRTGAEAGAKLHSASWGISFLRQGIRYRYDTQARNVDSYIAGNWDSLMIVAAGNDGREGPRSMNSPGLAKNVLSVGAAYTSQNRYGDDHIVDFSSEGPTPDGRIAPHVVAPGASIRSAEAIPDETGECEDDNALAYKSGTSMATPAVAGAAALARQYFVEGYYPSGARGGGESLDPSGTLVKAVLMNSGQEMTGKVLQDGVQGSDPYDNIQGFGRVSLVDTLRLRGQSDVVARVVDQVTVKDQEELVYSVQANFTICSGRDLRATLVWADPPGSSGCVSCSINDVDLTLTNDRSNVVYYPNGGTGPDRKNNAERIVIASADLTDGESWTATVRGYNLDRDEQQFSLIMSGCFSFDGQGDIGEVKPSSAPVLQQQHRLATSALALLSFGLFFLL